MIKKDIKKMGRFPSPLASDKIKDTKEYGIEYFKAMFEEWAGKGHTKYEDRRKKFMRSRRYGEGLQDTTKYKDLLDVEGDTSYLNLDWSPISIIPKFVDVVVGGMVNQDYEVKCSAIDPIAQDHRRSEQNKQVAAMLTAPFLKKLEKMSGTQLNYP